MNYKAVFTLTIAVISFTASSQNKDKELAQNGPFASIGKKSKVLTLPGHDYVYSAPDTVEYFGWGFSRSKQDFVYVKSEQEMAKDTVRKKLKNESRSRWLSIDPVVHPFESPYVGFSNNPIIFKDPDGGDIYPATSTAKQELSSFIKKPTSNDVINQFFENNFQTSQFKLKDKNGSEVLIETFSIDFAKGGQFRNLVRTLTQNGTLSADDATTAKALFNGLSNANPILEIGSYNTDESAYGSQEANSQPAVKQLTTNEDITEYADKTNGIRQNQALTGEQKKEQLNTAVNEFTDKKGEDANFKPQQGTPNVKDQYNQPKYVKGQYIYKTGSDGSKSEIKAAIKDNNKP